ncbi:MAG: NADP-dependent malic enzyme [Candidatus Liberibacter europaeus]|uniref:NADP-dependent malic enzyme n=1 Tax=Candidatus Liberibacter europaeus TaxID=744859 RepID=A0A2T4VY84_9HYPH|nr:NADP-dependent malic enzyme [Candidatus Liberibacter europaeus]PTL86735.1 MAG: NADP-dependent malic enzyme [Candidatus Liberibacter europaeus]
MEKKSSQGVKHSEFRSEDDLSKHALLYHQYPSAGKLEINATKPLNSQMDLSLAYSPGVGAPCMAISDDPANAVIYTARSNLVAVISNGSAVLGLGNIGPLASKPVMEGKAVLFKKFAGINVFDIEIDAQDVETMVATISALEPTFGGINLEDIKSPECFEVERILSEKMKIPVFHDDQHGTAITVAAAMLNGMKLVGKSFEEIKVVTLGAGAAALACLNLLVKMGVQRKNIWIHDLDGLVYKGRNRKIDQWKSVYCQDSGAKTFAETMEGADVFLGLSVAGALDPDVLKYMAKNPLIMPLANPIPEVMPDVVTKIRPDAMICTGRSDFANQVNNVLCFPYMFRGALDSCAVTINEEMKIAAVYAMAELARDVSNDVVSNNSSGDHPVFGRNYLIPSPFDPNLILRIAPAVARAAEETGVATCPIKDYDDYRDSLNKYAFPDRSLMRPIFLAAKKANLKRIVFSNGEDERVLRASQALCEKNIARPILIGSHSEISTAISRYSLKILVEKDFDIIDPNNNECLQEYVALYSSLNGQREISQEYARNVISSNTTVMASLVLKNAKADMCICGFDDHYENHLLDINKIIGKRSGINNYSAMSVLISHNRVMFFADTHVICNPSAQEIAEITEMAAQAIRSFGIIPRVSLFSNSSCRSHDMDSSLKINEALRIIRDTCSDLEIDGEETQGDISLSSILNNCIIPGMSFSEDANLLIFPNIDSANIALDIAKSITNGLCLGPILLGSDLPVRILPSCVSSGEIVDIVALSIAETISSNA